LRECLDNLSTPQNNFPLVSIRTLSHFFESERSVCSSSDLLGNDWGAGKNEDI
jgi:hypothetical protein